MQVLKAKAMKFLSNLSVRNILNNQSTLNNLSIPNNPTKNIKCK